MNELARPAKLLIMICLLAAAPALAAFKYVEEGQRAPDFSLGALSGEMIQLKDKLGPRALIVAFWASWSPRSRTMLDDLEELYRKRRENGLEVLAINVEHEELSSDDVKTVQELATNWSFSVLMDDRLSTYYSYGVVATPSLAIIDPQGIVQFTRASYSSSAREDIRETVDGMLGIEDRKAALLNLEKRDYVPPKKATLHYKKAQVLLERGMGRRAVQDLEEAARIDPAWVEPRLLLARIHWLDGAKHPESLEKAEAVLREANGLQPKHLKTLALLAEALERRGKSEEAVRVAQQALDIEPAYTPALLVTARSQRVLGNLEDARKAIDKAFELDPENASLIFEKGELAAARREWEDAARLLRRAVELTFSKSGAEG